MIFKYYVICYDAERKEEYQKVLSGTATTFEQTLLRQIHVDRIVSLDTFSREKKKLDNLWETAERKITEESEKVKVLKFK